MSIESLLNAFELRLRLIPLFNLDNLVYWSTRPENEALATEDETSFHNVLVLLVAESEVVVVESDHTEVVRTKELTVLVIGVVTVVVVSLAIVCTPDDSEATWWASETVATGRDVLIVSVSDKITVTSDELTNVGADGVEGLVAASVA